MQAYDERDGRLFVTLAAGEESTSLAARNEVLRPYSAKGFAFANTREPRHERRPRRARAEQALSEPERNHAGFELRPRAR